MVTKDMTIEIQTGLEARPVAVFVQVASQFDSSVYVEYGTKKVNAKSIMGMMSLNLTQGTSIELMAEGEDEEKAIDGVEKFLTAC